MYRDLIADNKGVIKHNPAQRMGTIMLDGWHLLPLAGRWSLCYPPKGAALAAALIISCGLCWWARRPRSIRICVLGLDNAGKSVLGQVLERGELDRTGLPTRALRSCAPRGELPWPRYTWKASAADHVVLFDVMCMARIMLGGHLRGHYPVADRRAAALCRARAASLGAADGFIFLLDSTGLVDGHEGQLVQEELRLLLRAAGARPVLVLANHGEVAA